MFINYERQDIFNKKEENIYMMTEKKRKLHTKTKEEITIDNITVLEETILNELENHLQGKISKEEYAEIIIYKILLFSLGGYEEKVAHRYCWDYFDKNKDYLLEQIP